MAHCIVGKPVLGENFIGRQREINQLSLDAEKNHVLLLAPRRVGKTSLVLEFKRQRKEQGHGALFMSAAGISSEVGFVNKLFDTLRNEPDFASWEQNHAQSLFSSLLGKIKTIKVSFIEAVLDRPGDWEEAGKQLTRALRAAKSHWYIIIDELPIFILKLAEEDPSGKRARRFLEWLRNERQTTDQDSDYLHWIVIGSIGLDTVTHRLRMTDTINDFLPCRLGELTHDHAHQLLNAIGEGEGLLLDEPTKNKMIEMTGWPIPYHLQLLFHELKKFCNSERSEPSPAKVEAAFQLALKNRLYFSYWAERLGDVFGALERDWAELLLQAASRSNDGCSLSTLQQQFSSKLQDPEQRDKKLRELLIVLENDGYLVFSQERYRFRSRLLREFWNHAYNR